MWLGHWETKFCLYYSIAFMSITLLFYKSLPWEITWLLITETSWCIYLFLIEWLKDSYALRFFWTSSLEVLALKFLSILNCYIMIVQIRSVTQSCPILCDPMNHSTPGLPVHHQLLEFTQTHAHRVSDAIQPSHPLSSPSPLVPSPSQHQRLFQWVNSLHEVAKVLEFQL